MVNRVDTQIHSALSRVFEYVESEWRVNKLMPGTIEQDDLKQIRYCPILDFAVGPFSTDKDASALHRNKSRITKAYEHYEPLIDSLTQCDQKLENNWWENNIDRTQLEPEHQLTMFQFKDINENPRCLMAIEVEKTTKQKHRMASIANAGALGKIGVLIAKGDAYRHLIRIRLYLRFLLAVKKPGIQPLNVIILPKDAFIEILDGISENNQPPFQ